MHNTKIDTTLKYFLYTGSILGACLRVRYESNSSLLGGLVEKSKPFDPRLPCGVKIDNGWEALNNSETK